MNDVLVSVGSWALSGVAGTLLGGVFFGGLWWTLRKVVVAKHPGLWFLGSMWLRSAVTVAGFYFVSNGHWQRLIACTVGFLCARMIATRLAQRAQPTQRAPEANHAP